MKKSWEIKKLGQVCRFINGRAYSKKELLTQGKYVVLRVGNFFTNNNWYYSDLELDEDKYCDSGDLLYAWSASFGPRIWTGNKVIYHYHIWKVIPDANLITKDFLFQLLEWDTEEIKVAHGTGTTMMHVGKGSIENRLVPIPPLPEQESIVSILDEAFAAINQAKENLQRNLQNAKDLFQSELNNIFTSKGDGWVEKKLGDIAFVKSGGTPLRAKKEYWDGDIPWYSSGELNSLFTKTSERFINSLAIENSNAKLFPKGSLLIGMYDTAALKMSILDKDATFNQAIAGVMPNEKIDLFFVLHSINAIKTDLLKQRRGVRQKNLSLEKIKEILIPFPKIETQQKIVRQLDILSIETQNLESIYQQKLNNLEELKKSILQKAFSGELTASVSQPQSIPLRRIEDISTTDLHAGLIAIAYNKHEKANTLSTFHHVKSEKIINLISYHLAIELDRNPVKDAAGPNDFTRLKKKVEPRALKAGFFKVTKDGDVYNYTKGTEFGAILKKTSEKLGNDLQGVHELIDLVVKLDREQAEVVATVYAAWNNLLLLGKEITDEAIVKEAREDWHESKLKIDRDKFFKTIKWMRNKSLIPKGTGTLILARK